MKWQRDYDRGITGLIVTPDEYKEFEKHAVEGIETPASKRLLAALVYCRCENLTVSVVAQPKGSFD